MKRIATASALIAAMTMSASAVALDAAKAQQVARQNDCFKCHAVDKKKDGPSYQEIAARYKGKPDAEARLVKHFNSGEKAKFPDGHEEEHKIIKTKDPEAQKNLAQWILSLQ